jgi:protein SCO1/2
MRRVFRLGACVALAVSLAGCGSAAKPVFEGTALNPPPSAPNFTLHDDRGNPVTMASHVGHPVVVAFLYTECPDVCPLIAQNLNQALKQSSAKDAGLQVVGISVDPKNDTPAAVRQYVAVHRLVSRFTYAIGSRAELLPVWKGYHVAVTPGASGTVTHSAFELLIDASGHERAVYGSDVTAAQVLHDLSELSKGA